MGIELTLLCTSSLLNELIMFQVLLKFTPLAWDLWGKASKSQRQKGCLWGTDGFLCKMGF